jgi:hypothetical protein
MADNKVSYLNKTFSDFKTNLVNYTKTYFPNSYNDFSDANPGAIFIELASYIGDVTSFYTDTQIQENFLLYAKERENLFALSYGLGYSPKMSYASNTIVDIFQLIPSSGSISVPDLRYGMIVPENTILTSVSTGTKFLTIDKVNFTDSTNTEITYVDTNYFLLKKSVTAISAEIKSTTLQFSTSQKFQIATITDTNILQILDATDASSNKWYEVPYLAQSSILTAIANPTSGSDGVPYLVNYTKVPRRYVSRFLSDDTLQLEFGAGISNASDGTLLPNPDNIQLGLIPGISNLLNGYNKANVFFTQEYGLAPSSNIIVRYLVGGGITANISSNDLTSIDKTGVSFPLLPSGVLPTDNLPISIKNSLASTNPKAATGGRGADEVEEIRNNALYAYQSQLRAVTREDYIVRALSLPANYGNIAKVHVTQDVAQEMISTSTVSTTEMRNPLSLDMYVLTYDDNKKLTTANNTLKQNLATYINQYRMVTDAVNIKDAFYINVGIDFDITVQRDYNNNDVLTNCILSLQDYFDINKWAINQPISISDIISNLVKIKGVQSVVKIEIVNKQGGNYSPYAYDIPGATRQSNIYPSIDPSIFEVRYPDTDIQGRVLGLGSTPLVC